jgi:hypothetical protein
MTKYKYDHLNVPKVVDESKIVEIKLDIQIEINSYRDYEIRLRKILLFLLEKVNHVQKAFRGGSVKKEEIQV